MAFQLNLNLNRQAAFVLTVVALLVANANVQAQDLSSSSGSGFLGLDPLVDTGVSPLSPQGRHVAVHVPAFFSMVLDTRGPNQGYRLDETVMSGLVRIKADRVRDASGNLTGPLQVKVGGITMYDNHAATPSS